jgi:hypothetical protein
MTQSRTNCKIYIIIRIVIGTSTNTALKLFISPQTQSETVFFKICPSLQLGKSISLRLCPIVAGFAGLEL